VLGASFDVVVKQPKVPASVRHGDSVSVREKAGTPFFGRICCKRRLSRGVRVASVFFLLCCLTVGAVAQSNAIPSPWQRKTEPGAFSRERSIPRVDRGYLFSFRRRILDDSKSNLLVRSLATGDETLMTFWITGASEIRVEDVAVGPTGQVYVAGSMMQPASLSLTNFVAAVDSSGSPTKVTDLGSYRPKRLCVANDGTFWTFGFGLGLSSAEGRGDRLLRQYSQGGSVLNAFLPSEKFPALAHLDFRHASAALACGDESVGLYLSKPARWVEVPFANPVANKWRIQPAPLGVLVGVALLGAHHVYASFAARTVGSDGLPETTGKLYKLTLPTDGQDKPVASSVQAGAGGERLQSGNRAKANWTSLSDGSSAAGKVFLLGRDEQSLVFAGGKTQGADPTLYWVRP